MEEEEEEQEADEANVALEMADVVDLPIAVRRVAERAVFKEAALIPFHTIKRPVQLRPLGVAGEA